MTILSDPGNVVRARRSFEGFVDPARIAQVFRQWAEGLRSE